MTPSLLTSNFFSGVSSFSTTSISPSTGKLIIFCLVAYKSDFGSTLPIVNSFSGNGLTWTLQVTHSDNGGGHTGYLWSIYTAFGTPSAGSISVTLNETCNGLYVIQEVDGAVGVAQSAFQKSNDGGANPCVVTFANPYSNTNNRPFGFGWSFSSALSGYLNIDTYTTIGSEYTPSFGGFTDGGITGWIDSQPTSFSTENTSSSTALISMIMEMAVESEVTTWPGYQSPFGFF